MKKDRKIIINLLFALLIITPLILYFSFKPQYKFQNGRYRFEYDLKQFNKLRPYADLIYTNKNGDITAIDTYYGENLQRGAIENNQYRASLNE